MNAPSPYIIAHSIYECLDKFFIDRSQVVFNSLNTDIEALQAMKWLDLTHKQKINELKKLTGFLLVQLSKEQENGNGSAQEGQ